MTKEDFLASCIVNLAVGEDGNFIYSGYYRDNKNVKIDYLEMSHRVPKENDEYSSVNIQLQSNGEIQIDGIKDEEVTKQNAKEFYKQLKEKYEQQQELKLQKAWMRLGVYE